MDECFGVWCLFVKRAVQLKHYSWATLGDSLEWRVGGGYLQGKTGTRANTHLSRYWHHTRSALLSMAQRLHSLKHSRDFSKITHSVHPTIFCTDTHIHRLFALHFPTFFSPLLNFAFANLGRQNKVVMGTRITDDAMMIMILGSRVTWCVVMCTSHKINWWDL